MNHPKSAIVGRLKVIKSYLKEAWPRVETELRAELAEGIQSKDGSAFNTRLNLCLKEYTTAQDPWVEKLVADTYVTLAELDQLIRIDDNKLYFPTEALRLEITSDLVAAALYTVEIKYTVAVLQTVITADCDHPVLPTLVSNLLPGATHKGLQLCEQLIRKIDDMPF